MNYVREQRVNLSHREKYHNLRKVIFHVAEANSPLAEHRRDIILDSIEQLINCTANKISGMDKKLLEKI